MSTCAPPFSWAVSDDVLPFINKKTISPSNLPVLGVKFVSNSWLKARNWLILAFAEKMRGAAVWAGVRSKMGFLGLLDRGEPPCVCHCGD
jgi:hypothetical protein